MLFLADGHIVDEIAEPTAERVLPDEELRRRRALDLMLRATFKSLLAHKLRMAMSALAIVLGSASPS